jgi:LacI family transcriptional regulator
MKLKELAEQLGLSQTTVSRALNGYPEVNEATRERVSEAARRHGYRPNISARRLATGRVGAIGVFLPGLGSVELGPHTSEFLSGLAGRMAPEEIDIVVSPLEGEDEIPAYRRLSSSKRVDAVVIASPRLCDERVKVLTEMGIPFVLHGRTEIDTPHAWLDIDNEGAFRRATSQGYREALADRGIMADPRFITNGRFTDEVGFRTTQALLELSPRPTAFLAGSMMTALGVFRAIRSVGLELGKDVSMIAHDDVFPYLNADNMVPSMSTTRSSIRAAGARIAELILQLLAGKPAASIHELWPVELVLRESTAPPPGA